MISLRSQIARKVLGYFYLNEASTLYVNQMARELNLDRGNLVKKLKELEKAGILASEQRGREKYYQLNKEYPLYKEYKGIFQKTSGLEKQIEESLRTMQGVDKAWIFGSYVRGTMDAASDIDLLVVGDQSIMDVQRKIGQLQRDFGRQINVVNMSSKDYTKRKSSGDPFLAGVFGHGTKQLI